MHDISSPQGNDFTDSLRFIADSSPGLIMTDEKADDGRQMEPAQAARQADDQHTAGNRSNKYLGTGGAVFLFLYLAVILVLSFVVILAVWPQASLETWLGTMSAELRYLLLVAAGGALGSSVHDLSTFITTVSGGRIRRNWLWSYLFRILITVPLVLVFYMAIRGGILSPEATTNILNPYGLLIASIFVGIFTPSIVDRLLLVDRALLGQESQLERQIEQIGATLGVVSLDNYDGFVCLLFRDEGGKPVSSADDKKPVLRPGPPYRLVVWFQPNRLNSGVSEDVRIQGGRDAREVEFHLVPDSDNFGFRPRQKSVSFPVVEPSPEAEFQFRAPTTEGAYELWVEVSQKNRFILIVSATFHVEGRLESPT